MLLINSVTNNHIKFKSNQIISKYNLVYTLSLGGAWVHELAHDL